MGPTFLDSLHQFTSRTLIIDWKKIHFRFFSLKKDISTTYVTTTLVDFTVFCSYTPKLGYYQRFDSFMMSWKYKKPTQLMQYPFRMCKVKIYMGIPWSLWPKWQECHFCDKKTKKCFFLVSKGCFWCKMRGGIQKSWSRCSTILTFCEIGTFLKKMIFATNLSQPYF